MSLERVCVFGLGEAGSLFAADLASAGVAVSGFDPAGVGTPAGVHRCSSPADAVADAQLVLALTAAADATTALGQALEAMAPTTVYADLSTASAGLKRSLAASADAAGLAFVDVALMAVVPGHGLRAPALVAGSGATRYVELLGPLGVPVESVGGEPGEAATRKLLRSVFMKGLAGVVIEALRAAEAAGRSEWLWRNIVDELASADAVLLERLVTGTERHAVRRLHEMEAAASLLGELGVEPTMATATVASIRQVMATGIPGVPATTPGTAR